MASNEKAPLFNQFDIDDTFGPVGTVDDGGGLSRLKVIDIKKPSDIPGVPSFSDKYRSDFDEPTPLALTASYQEIFSHTGTGKFVGFVATFSNANVEIKLSADSNTIFEMTSAQINDSQFGNPVNTGPGGQQSSGGPTWDQAGRRYGFMPPHGPIEFGTNVKIEAKKVGAPTINYVRSIVNLTKET